MPTFHNSTFGEGEVKVSDRARYTIDWIQKHIYVDAGVRMNLAPFQVGFIAKMQSGDGDRDIRRAVLSCGRKQGKTTLAAALITMQLSSQLAPRDTDSFFASAAAKTQSFLGFDAMVGFIDRNPKLADRWSVNPMGRNMYNKSNLNRVQALATNVRSVQGKLAHCAAFDELSQAKDDLLLDAIERSQTKNDHWLIITSTMSNYAGNPLSDTIDMVKQGHARGMLNDWHLELHAAPLDADIYSDEAIIQANPGLHGNPPLIEWSVVNEEREQAKLNPSKRLLYRVYRLNQESSAKSPLVAMEAWKAIGCSPDERAEFESRIEGTRVRLGVDLSVVKDLSSVAIYFPDAGYLKTMSWIPRESVKDAERTDRMPYSELISGGWLRECDGPVIEYRDIAEYIAEAIAKYDVEFIRYDPFKIPALRESLRAVGVDFESEDGKKRWTAVRQGYYSYTPILSMFESMVEKKAFKHENSPILNAAIYGTKIEHSPNLASGARRPTKAGKSVKIDSAIASLMAIGVDSSPVERKKEFNMDTFMTAWKRRTT